LSNLEIFVSVIGVLLGYFIVSKFLNRNNSSNNSPEAKKYLPGKTMSEEEFRAAELLFNNKKEGYIVKHWRGHHSLSKSFWLNNFAINVLFLIITAYWADFGPRTEDPVLLARVILSLTVLGYVIIYPWQFIGLWRSANFYIKDKQKKFWPRAVKLLLIIGALITLVDLTTEQQIYKDLYHHSFELTKESNYDVRLEDQTITLNGDLNYGISEAVDQLILDNPYVDSIVLNSNGGLVYEGSQLSFLILSNSLNTYTTSGCKSACTIAFISGNRRYISKGSNLGFHQYSNYRKQSAIEKIALFDLQQDDANLFKKRGVSEEFIDLMYQASPDDMWYPTDDELFAYGIVHEYAK
jgi:ATP-dependent protease ClpP protease subunit